MTEAVPHQHAYRYKKFPAMDSLYMHVHEGGNEVHEHTFMDATEKLVGDRFGLMISGLKPTFTGGTEHGGDDY